MSDTELSCLKNNTEQQNDSKGNIDYGEDAALMLQCQKGDLKSYEALFKRYSKRILNFVFKFIGNRQISEEITQDIFIKIYENRSNYQPKAKFSVWLYRIATNHCLNEVRKPGYRYRFTSMDETIENGSINKVQVSSTLPDPEEKMQTKQMIGLIEKALLKLPERQRTVIILNKVKGLSYDEVSEIMETSSKAIKSLLNRARVSLAAEITSLKIENN